MPGSVGLFIMKLSLYCLSYSFIESLLFVGTVIDSGAIET